MKPTTLSSLLALALSGNAWAASPYDSAYGVQWSFLIGNPNADAPNTLAVSPDGTVWITTGGTGSVGTAPMLTWGSPKSVYGGTSASGYGQISRLGGILQCNDIPNVTGISSYSQGAAPTVAFSGSNPTAYIGFQPNSAFRWTDASPADVAIGSAQPVTFAIGSVLNQTGFAPYGDYVNPGGSSTLDTTLPRKNDPLDATKKFSHNLVALTAYGGAAMDFKVGSDGSYYFGRQNQASSSTAPLSTGDAFTVGDFSGPIGGNYKP
jgi:streptogramin lyase